MSTVYYTYYTPVSQKIPEIEKQEHMLGRQLLVKGLHELYNIHLSPDGIQPHLTTETQGKPKLTDYPNIHFNISHCPGLVVCAFSGTPIGVDAELPGYFPPILIQRALSEAEKKILITNGTTPQLEQEWFYRLWTLKEAYVKKTGQGVDTDLTSFSFSFHEAGENIQVICSDPLTACCQMKLEQGHILSLCQEKTPNEAIHIPNLISCRLS